MLFYKEYVEGSISIIEETYTFKYNINQLEIYC